MFENLLEGLQEPQKAVILLVVAYSMKGQRLGTADVKGHGVDARRSSHEVPASRGLV